jgi:predicted PurR-regulated permease PerM
MPDDRRNDVSGADRLIRSAAPLLALGGFVLVLVGALGLREVASLVVPVMFGLFIALTAWPMVGTLERRGVRHGFALAGAIVVVLAVVLLAASIAALSVGELVVQIPKYEGRLNAELAALRDLLAQLGIDADPGAITAIVSPESISRFVKPVASAVSDAGGAMFVLAFTMIYALAGGTSLRARAVAAFGERHALLLGTERFATDLRRYLVVRAKLGLFAAVLSFVLLFVLGVPFPILWAILVFAASFIPNIGTLIALIPPTILAFLDSGPSAAVMVIVGYTLINLAQDQFLQPLAMGSELNLSPLVVFIAVIVWAWILGAAGALLAVPLTVGLVMFLEAFPSSRRYAALLRSKVEPRPGIVDEAAATG